jgi:hypothetical protein
LAARHTMPAICDRESMPRQGAFCQMGVYVARVLKVHLALARHGRTRAEIIAVGRVRTL